MDTKKDTRSGHRDRTYERILSYPESLREYEILEGLLFYCIPRKDTKPLAHTLLDKFGSLYGVISATTDELLTVEGIGQRAAAFLKLQETIYSAMKKSEALDHGKPMLNFDRIAKIIIEDFDGEQTERFRLYFMDNRSHLISKSIFETFEKSRVIFNATAVAQATVVSGAKIVIVAHNHPSGIVFPTDRDDVTTLKLYELFKMHDVRMVDHVIVWEDKLFSYNGSGRFEEILKNQE